MSEKGLERETEGISVGEREPVVADSSPKGGRLRSSWKKLWKGRKRKALALLLVVAIAGGVVIWRGRGQTASAATTYQEAAVERRSITNSLSSSGHGWSPADSYTVNTLVSGEILSDTFEKGDQVEEGQLLYTIDSSNAASSQTQAQNSYSQAQTSYEQAVKAKYPQADLSGTVSEVYVNEGDSVSAGTQLLKIVADENIYIDFYFTYADSGDFYIGQTATVFIDGFAGTLTGTVAAVSSSSAAVSTGRTPDYRPGTGSPTGPCDIRLHRQRRHRQLLQLRPGVHQGGGQQRHHGRGVRQSCRFQLAGGRYHLQRRPDLHHHR